jgi:hypothetical protein
MKHVQDLELFQCPGLMLDSAWDDKTVTGAPLEPKYGTIINLPSRYERLLRNPEN